TINMCVRQPYPARISLWNSAIRISQFYISKPPVREPKVAPTMRAAKASLPAYLQNAGAIVFLALIATGVPYLVLMQKLFFSSGAGFSLASWLNVDPALTAGTFLGIITASFIYLMTTWFAMKDRSQVYLMLMLLCLMVHMAASSGYFDRFSNYPILVAFL